MTNANDQKPPVGTHEPKEAGTPAASDDITYNREAAEYARSGQSEKAAEEAERAVEGPEGEELRKAEQVGKEHAKSGGTHSQP